MQNKVDSPVSSGLRPTFFTVFRACMPQLCELSLLYGLFCLPAIVLLTASFMSLLTAPPADLSLSEALLSAWLPAIPWLALTGPAASGACAVTGYWADDRSVLLWQDFRDAMKARWKPALLLSLLQAVVPALLLAAWELYGRFGLPMMQILLAIPMLLWFLVSNWLQPLLALGRPKLLQNALLLALGCLPASLTMLVCGAFPVLIASALLMLTGSEWALFGLVLYMLLIGLGLHRLIVSFITNTVFRRVLQSSSKEP